LEESDSARERDCGVVKEKECDERLEVESAMKAAVSARPGGVEVAPEAGVMNRFSRSSSFRSRLNAPLPVSGSLVVPSWDILRGFFEDAATTNSSTSASVSLVYTMIIKEQCGRVQVKWISFGTSKI
jgi:hypothetical protein